MTNYPLVNEYQARRGLWERLCGLSHDLSEKGYLGAYARLSKIEKLEPELAAVAKRLGKIRDKIRDAGPEFVYDDSRPRRRHKNT